MLGYLAKRGLQAACLPRFRNFSSKKNDTPPTLTEQVKNIFYPEISPVDLTPIGSEVPYHGDIVVIGGGAMGSAIAYFLKLKYRKNANIVVIEKDPTYSKASTCLSVGGLRQQFSLEENIHMSLFGAEFLRGLNQHLAIEGEPPVDISFHPYGYLLLASEKKADILMENSKLQNSMGAKNILLSPEKLKDMFPWINVEGIELACLGLEREGWFDPYSLLCAFRKKAISMGVEYVHGEATGFKTERQVNLYTMNSENEPVPFEKLKGVFVKTPDGEEHTIGFAMTVIAAGPHSAKIAEKAGIGLGGGLLAVPLPVEPRKRFVYCFHCPDGPALNTPMTIDSSGTYFRRDGLGGLYICGRSPPPEEEPPVEDLSVDHDFFDNKIWPVLAHRVKAFESLKVKSSWAGYYEYNTFDQNGIIGPHPLHKNLYVATGFSGHGIQQAPAVGRAISELIFDQEYTTIDLSRLGFERLVESQPIFEQNCF